MNEDIRIVLVEDEPITGAYLQNLLQKSSFPCSVVKTLDSVHAAEEFFQSDTLYDLVFMDIHLGDGTCFDLLNGVRVDQPIVFCTTFDSYAIEAFRYNSLDYILKPAQLQDIENSLKKYKELQSNQRTEYLERMDQMMESLVNPSYKKRFLIRFKNKLTLMNIEQIMCFYSEEGNTFLLDTMGQSYPIDYTLDRLESLIDPRCFFRINRKTIICMDFIHSVEDYFNNRLKIRLSKKNELELVVSRNRVKPFKDWLKNA